MQTFEEITRLRECARDINRVCVYCMNCGKHVILSADGYCLSCGEHADNIAILPDQVDMT